MKRALPVVALLLIFVTQFAHAQDTTAVRRDTAAILARDSAALQLDSATAATPPVFADSVHPIPQLASFYHPPAGGFIDGVWEWDHDAFMNEAAMTLGDLLERIPGILTLRSGLYLQPEAAASMGGTANRLEVWLDGFALDPLLESSFDLSRLELANVQSVRIERRLRNIRVYIETLSPKDSRAYSMVEAGVGEPDANLFRGLFLAPRLIFGPLGVAVDRIDTDGLAGNEPADQFAGWAKWSFIRNGSGVQVEYRRAGTDRDPEAPWPAQYNRSDVIVRARAKLRDHLVAEAFAGRSTLDVDTVTEANNDSTPSFEQHVTQIGARASFDTPMFWARGSFRVRDAEQLASTQIEAAVGARVKLFSAAAEASQSSWRDAGNATDLSLRAQAGPFHGFTIFGERTDSDRGAPFLEGYSDSSVVVTNFKGYRAGAQLEWRGITVAGALLKMQSDSVTTFGLPFDRQRRLYLGSDATGAEASGRIPIPWISGLSIIGNITNWQSGTLSLYMPTRMYRAGLELHAIPLKSGNLEILGRIEAIQRGAMLAPDPAAPDSMPGPVTLPAVNYFDAYLQIRIIDVRAFLRYEDLSAENVAEIPNRALRGPRLFYGVKWQFFN